MKRSERKDANFQFKKSRIKTSIHQYIKKINVEFKKRSNTKSLKNSIAKGLFAILVAIGGACLEASTDLIKNNFEPALVAVRNISEDLFSPLTDNALIGLNLAFYMPSAKAGETIAEAVSATIPGSLCLAPNGHNIVRAFDESDNGHQTNVIMHIACRPSGRISVSFAPQNGHDIKVYEGRFSDGDKIAFPGVPGSYYAGILTMHKLNAREPKEPWVPANTCQQSNTCEDIDVSSDE